MYSRLSNAPSKSMSDILEATQPSQQTRANALRGLPCKPCKTYSYDNLNTKGTGVQVESDTCKFENARDSPVNSRTSKLHNFVRRVVASIERRSDERGDCKADNEFFAKYTKPSCTSLAVERFSENVSFVRSSQEETWSDYGFINKRVTRSTEGKNDNPKNFRTASFERNKFCTETRGIRLGKEADGDSLEDRFNGTHANIDDNETRMRKVKTLPASMRESQNVSRKKSFKSLFSSIISRKRSEKLFKSCDDLNEKSGKYDKTDDMMFRTVSLQNVTDHKKVPQNFIATCVVYNSEKLQSIVQSSDRKSSRAVSHMKNDSCYRSGSITSEEISDNSVRPSIVRNIAKRFSQVSNYSQLQRDTVAPSPQRNIHHKKCVTNYSDDVSKSKESKLSQRESSAVFLDRKLETEH